MNARRNRSNGGWPDALVRWAGADGYETATVVVESALKARYVDLDTLGIATGLDFPDALGGGAALGYYGSGILLAAPTSVPASVNVRLADREYEIGRLDVFGGTAVVSDAVFAAMADAIQWRRPPHTDAAHTRRRGMKTASWLRRIARSALVMAMLLGGTAWANGPSEPPVSFTTGGLATSPTDWDQHPVIDGGFVVWESQIAPAYTDHAVYVHNLRTGETRPIGVGDGFRQENPDVSGYLVVYQDNSSGNADIKMYNWWTDASVSIASGSNSEVDPHIDGNLIVWKVTQTGQLWYRNLDDPYVPVAQITFAGDDAFDYDVNNGRVFWSDPDFGDLRVQMVRPPVFTGQLSALGPQPTSLEVHGDRVVYSQFVVSNWQALTYDIRSRVVSILAATSMDEFAPTVFHDTYAWTGPGIGGADIAYARPGHENSILGVDETDGNASLYGHRLVYDSCDGIDFDVWLATATSKLQSRTSGANRYATAAAVSRAYFSAGSMVLPQLDNVVLCTGENFPDALAAAPLARALQAPLLLTRRNSIPDETLAEITRLAPTKIYIIGGDSAVSTAVENHLKATYTTERIAGSDRYETSAKVAKKMEDIVGTQALYRAFFARGDAFPDALAVGPVAAGAQAPVLLVRPNAVPASVASAVTALDITSGHIAGGTSAVSAPTAASLDALIMANGSPIGCQRLAGGNRYATAAAIVGVGVMSRWVDLDTLGVATGANFPDALGGGAAMAYYGSPIVLTDGASLSAATSDFLTEHAYDIGRVDVFGGTAVVSEVVYNAIAAKIQ